MSARRTERLLNLVLALLSTRRGLRKDQLRTAVPQYAECVSDVAFERMFERDKEDLREIGVPVETVLTDVLSDTPDGYRIDAAAYELRDVAFSSAEVAVLGLASRVWQQATFAAPASRGLSKLTTRGGTGEAAALPGVDPRVRTVEPAFAPLYAATRDRTPVAFEYRRPDGGRALRQVEPWRIVLRRGVWYLLGRDRDRSAARVFRLGRIVGRVRTTGEQGSILPPAPEEVEQALVGLADRRPPVSSPVTATVAVRAGRGGRVRARAADSVQTGRPPTTPQPLAQTSSGSVPPGFDLLTLPMAELDHLASDLAALGDDVLVISPPSLLEEVLRRWQGAADAHGGPAPVPVQEPAAAVSTPVAAGGAADRLSRLLALVPYVLQRGEVQIDELAAHFTVSPAQLVKDLELLFVCGTPGHLPDDLIEAEWDHGMVRIGNAEPISRPLRLSADEAIALRLGLQLLHDVPGPHDRAALTSAADKLALLGGAGGDPATIDPVTVVADHARTHDEHTVTVERALAEGRRLHLRYLSAGRDELTERDVDPERFVHADGRTYLEGWCHRADGTRLFRLDRVVGARLLDTAVQERAVQTRSDTDTDTGTGAGGYVPGPDDLEVVLRLHRGAGWLVEHYPGRVLGSPTGSPGAVDFSLQVADVGRAARLVLGFDGAAEVLRPPALRTAVAMTAARALLAHGG